MVLNHPSVTEKAMAMLENENKLVFIVRKEANKEMITRDIEKTFGKTVADVRTLMTNKGTKKAIVSFEDDRAAEEILSRLGIV
ncbi:MAG: 50S ribosomal protein L23P [Methanomicrobiales archaeon 53_19]|jgi:large subunit ribosomal protein L23|uniref:50S ribosomal protein L23 n=1 Tax=Methanocalculus sp. TaxID=2004547 RepID=UPI00074B28F3|nr:50S ribosomal protein L23 [Methanocalculus sp.]KUK68315.1 MAG: 50S ribosomal protein L23P [Methanocalculus sp. 52_23]KUL03822.1 MAG: 50S ribosomal protein L23P [Methanomicrobiales archaeon 53_19]HIJ07482.1 50S ribosomal protein L23 [Methanocalculus sp.]